jgi:hypothetical protein
MVQRSSTIANSASSSSGTRIGGPSSSHGSGIGSSVSWTRRLRSSAMMFSFHACQPGKAVDDLSTVIVCCPPDSGLSVTAQGRAQGWAHRVVRRPPLILPAAGGPTTSCDRRSPSAGSTRPRRPARRASARHPESRPAQGRGSRASGAANWLCGSRELLERLVQAVVEADDQPAVRQHLLDRADPVQVDRVQVHHRVAGLHQRTCHLRCAASDSIDRICCPGFRCVGGLTW